MTQKYTHLTEEQRYQIQVLFAEENSRGQIAKKIACYKSTVSREIKRNSVEGAYKAKNEVLIQALFS
jgi:IS30 family transposase